MLYGVVPDVRELEKWLTHTETRVVRQVAASTITTLVRRTRTRSIRLIKGRMGVPTKQVSKRIRAWRAHPKTLRGGLMVNSRDIPEIVLGRPRQTGHPGERRKSGSKAAKRMRAYRKSKGAKPSRAGGVKASGRAFDGAWIGTTRKDGAGKRHVRKRRRKTTNTIWRDWKPALRTIGDQTRAASSAWSPVFSKRLKEAFAKRGQTKAASFLQDQGKI